MREEVVSAGQASLRLCCYDCFPGLRDLVRPGELDVVVTSPPYNIGVQYGSYDDKQPREQYLAWLDEWASLIASRLAEQGSLFLNLAGKPSDPWVPYEVAGVVRRHLVLQNVIHWIKSLTIERADVGRDNELTQDLTVGHFKPIPGPRFVNDCHEFIFHFTRTGHTPLERLALGVPYEDKSNVRRWKQAKDDRRCRGNCWFIPYKTIQSRDRERPHPATFPPKLAEMCLKLHGVERVRLACDPFLGLGSSALACADLRLPFVGFELDEQYFTAAVARLRDHLGLLSSPA
jgi:site-specific DNA-methyltransferase (adenine-specific)